MQTDVLVSRRARSDFALTADPEAPPWKRVPGVIAERGRHGEIVAGHRTEIRSRWTAKNLYLLFVCPYEELSLKPDPSSAAETNKLWDWDVAEAFIGSDFQHVERYKEFQVSPQGEWVDLAIDRGTQPPSHDVGWNSGYEVKARLDRARRIIQTLYGPGHPELLPIRAFQGEIAAERGHPEVARHYHDRGRVKTDHEYRTNLENVWSVGDCISIHWPAHMSMGGYRHPDLAHVAHHEAVLCVERICGHVGHEIDYRFIPGCTYTHPQVASMGYTEKKAREEGKQIKIGKFPFQASGRALAAGEPDGFVKLIFDAKYGELLGVHMIGETVTELLSELVLARNLEATEAEIIEAMHPHPTMSEAVMEAAGVADGRSIHL